MGLNNANQPISVSVYLGTVSGSKTVPAVYMGRRSELKAAWLMNGAAEAHSGTNYVQVALGIVGGATLATFDGTTQDLAQNVAALLAAGELPEPGSQGGSSSLPNEYPLDIPAGSSLQAAITVGGSGTLTDAKLVLEYFPL